MNATTLRESVAKMRAPCTLKVEIVVLRFGWLFDIIKGITWEPARINGRTDQVWAAVCNHVTQVQHRLRDGMNAFHYKPYQLSDLAILPLPSRRSNPFDPRFSQPFPLVCPFSTHAYSLCVCLPHIVPVKVHYRSTNLNPLPAWPRSFITVVFCYANSTADATR